MNITIQEAAKAVGGTYTSDGIITSICRDTRDIKPGSLFIALKGDRMDGHIFAQKAEQLGAAAILAHKQVDVNIPVIMCKDTRKAILDLAGYYRNKFNIPVVGLTGSVGKTTTKEMVTGVLSQKYNTLSTIGNLNNEIGLPLTIFRLEKEHEAAVLEMGMSNFGEISNMAKPAHPTIGLITNIGVSHMETLGSQEGILKAKSEILDGMDKNSPLILNGDDQYLRTLKPKYNPVIYYSIENPDARFKAKQIQAMPMGTHFSIQFDGKCQEIILPAIGLHNVYNALAAFAVGIVLGVDPKAAVDALSNYIPSGMRQKVVKCGSITVIEDCYNASPDSIKAALSALSAIPCHGKRIAVLGDMLELGSISEESHLRCGILASQSADVLLTCGDLAKFYVDGAISNGMKNAVYFETKDELSRYLDVIVKDGDTILFKASRGMKFEELLAPVYERWSK